MRRLRIELAGTAVLLASLLMLPACVKRVDNSEQTRADYEKTINDSIENVKREIDSCQNQIDILRERVATIMNDFTTVAKPREVGSYTIFKPFASRYPLSSTGLVARIDENSRFELVAALSGRHFDQVAVKVPSGTAQTSVVPNDQALNYRTASLTTVLFSGEAADSVGALIADNELNPVSVIYMQGNPVQAWKLPEENARMISQTWLLYKANSDLHRLERRVPMLNEKINLLRLHLSEK